MHNDVRPVQIERGAEGEEQADNNVGRERVRAHLDGIA